MSSTELERFMVTGGAGMLGRVVPFGRKFTHAELDVTRPEEVARICQSYRPAGILHLAALDIRQSERDPFQAYQVNVLGAYHLAREAEKQKCPFVFVSSGAVFSGPRGTAFDEDCLPAPVNVYGQSKYLAEILLRQMTTELLLVRTGWLFGAAGARRPKFVDLAIERGQRGESILASDDQDGSPTSVWEFLSEVARLIVAGERGVVHVVNSGSATAADMAREILRVLQSSSKLEVVSAADVPESVSRRSASEILASKRVRLRPWQEALGEYVKKRTT